MSTIGENMKEFATEVKQELSSVLHKVENVLFGRSPGDNIKPGDPLAEKVENIEEDLSQVKTDVENDVKKALDTLDPALSTVKTVASDAKDIVLSVLDSAASVAPTVAKDAATVVESAANTAAAAAPAVDASIAAAAPKVIDAAGVVSTEISANAPSLMKSAETLASSTSQVLPVVEAKSNSASPVDTVSASNSKETTDSTQAPATSN